MPRGRPKRSAVSIKAEPLGESEISETPRVTRSQKAVLSVDEATPSNVKRSRSRKIEPQSDVPVTAQKRKRVRQSYGDGSPTTPVAKRTLTVSGKRGRPKKSDNSNEDSIFCYYFKEPYEWFKLTNVEKAKILAEESNKTCPKCEYDLTKGSAKTHLEACILPTYYSYVGRFPEFRALDAAERRKLIVSATTGSRPAPCLDLSCGGAYRGASGLTYHVSRCGLTVDKIPWTCHRCKYEGLKSEAASHLKRCRNQESDEKEVIREALMKVLRTAEEEGHAVLTEKLQHLRKLDGEGLLDAIGGAQFADFIFINAAKHAKLLMETDFNGVPTRLSMAGGSTPKSHSRLSTKNGVTRFKFRNVAVTNGKSNPYNVYEYTLSVGRSRKMFCTKLGKIGVIQLLQSADAPDLTVQNVDEDLTLQKWLNRSSLKLDVRSTLSQRAITDPDAILNDKNACLSTLKSRTFPYTLHGKVQKNLHVDVIATRSEEISKSGAAGDLLKTISANPAYNEQCTAVLSVGGPVLTIRTAPQRAADEAEVVLITTAMNEASWEHPLDVPTYIQFWKYNGTELRTEPSLWFLLRLDGVGNVADVAWCPFFTESILQSVESSDSDVLGYIAVTTDAGRIIGYRIEKEYNFAYEAVDDNLPPVISLTPSFVLQQPVCVIVEPYNDEIGTNVEGFIRTIRSEPIVDEPIPLPSDGRRRSNRVPNFVEASDSDDDTTLKTKKKKSTKKVEQEYAESGDDDEASDEEEEDDDDEDGESDEVEETSKRQKGAKKTPIKKRDRDLIVNSKKRSKKRNNDMLDDDESVADGDSEDLLIERAVTNVPLTALDWGIFKQCAKIAAVSAAGFIHFWDLTTYKADATHEGLKAYTSLCDESWEAPPNSVKWMGEDTVAIGFRNRMVIYYRVSTLTQLYSDSTNRSAGNFVAAQQITFPGIFSYDSVRVVPVAGQIPYQIGMYQVLDVIKNTGLVMGIPNRHFGQCFDMSICENSGILGSVGLDGRLVESLNGRIAPRDEKDDFACALIRPVLHLVRHRAPIDVPANDEGDDDPLAAPPLVEHDLLTKSSWLEVRVGDAVDPVVDNTIEVERATFDRRTEALTRIDFSRHTPGVALVGGEAGIVFIIPSSL